MKRLYGQPLFWLVVLGIAVLTAGCIGGGAGSTTAPLTVSINVDHVSRRIKGINPT